MPMWAQVQPGDTVTLRPKRVAGDEVVAVVGAVLERENATGLGLLTPAGVTYRQWFYDLTYREPASPQNQ